MALTLSGSNGVAGVDGSAGTPALQGSDSNTGIAFGADTIIGSTGGSERFRVDSSGRLGIGSTNPQRKLVVSEGGAQGFEFFPGDAGGGNTLNHYNRSTSAFITVTTNADQHIWGRADGEKARIDSSGRWLLGTSSAAYSGASANLQLVHADGPDVIIARNQTTLAAGQTLGRIMFYGNDSDGTYERCAVIEAAADLDHGTGDKPSRLVFSTTADGASSPTERCRISNLGKFYARAASTDVAFFSTGSGAAAGDSFISCRHSSTTVTDGTEVFRVRTTGDVQNTNNSYGAISDIKLKENIVDATPQWSDIKALQVRKYNFKEGQTHTQIGLVAQEVELVSPGLVSESPDRDEDGNDLGTVTKSVNYSVLYMKAVKALQEAMERIETLEGKVAALESA